MQLHPTYTTSSNEIAILPTSLAKLDVLLVVHQILVVPSKLPTLQLLQSII